MRDLVQLALPQKTTKPRAETAGQRAGDRAFNDILQLKPGKAGAVCGKEPPTQDSPSPPSPAFRIKFGNHGVAGLSAPAYAPAELFQQPPAEAVEETGEDMGEIVPSADKMTADDESELLMLDVLMPDEPETAESDEPDPDIVDDAATPGPALASIQTVAIASAQAPRQGGSRSERPQTLSADAPDIAGSAPSPRVAGAEAAKPADRPALTPAQATAQKALPPVTIAPDGAEAEKPAHQPAPATGDRASARQMPLTMMAEAAAHEGKPEPASRAEPDTLRSAPPSSAIENRQDMPRLGANVRVVESLSVPAPQVPSPGASVTNAIASAPQWISFARSGPVTASSHTAEPMKLLTIQLRPIELGSVTAKLRLVGDQLTIELQVERAEAYDRLSTDRETILKAVRALGIEVDKVTIQQPQAQSPVNARSENSAAFNGGARDANFSAPGGSGGRDSGEAGSHRGRDAGDEPGSRTAGAALSHQNGEGRGLYI